MSKPTTGQKDIIRNSFGKPGPLAKRFGLNVGTVIRIQNEKFDERNKDVIKC